jgi:hypothetical protein
MEMQIKNKMLECLYLFQTPLVLNHKAFLEIGPTL